MLKGISALKNKSVIFFRNEGKKVSFDIIVKDGKIIKALLDLGLDFTEYHKIQILNFQQE